MAVLNIRPQDFPIASRKGAASRPGNGMRTTTPLGFCAQGAPATHAPETTCGPRVVMLPGNCSSGSHSLVRNLRPADSISLDALRLFLTRPGGQGGRGVACAGPHPALLRLARRGGGSRGGGSGGGEGSGGGLVAAADGLAGIGAVRRLLPARRRPGHGRKPQSSGGRR